MPQFLDWSLPISMLKTSSHAMSSGRIETDDDYWIELAAEENALFAFDRPVG